MCHVVMMWGSTINRIPVKSEEAGWQCIQMIAGYISDAKRPYRITGGALCYTDVFGAKHSMTVECCEEG